MTLKRINTEDSLVEYTLYHNFTNYYVQTDVKLDINLKYFLNNANTVEFNNVEKQRYMVLYPSFFIPLQP